MLVDRRDGPAELVRQNGTSFRFAFEEQRYGQSTKGIEGRGRMTFQTARKEIE